MIFLKNNQPIRRMQMSAAKKTPPKKKPIKKEKQLQKKGIRYLKRSESFLHPFGLRLPYNNFNELRDYANNHKKSVNQCIGDIIDELIKHHKKEFKVFFKKTIFNPKIAHTTFFNEKQFEFIKEYSESNNVSVNKCMNVMLEYFLLKKKNELQNVRFTE
jgi:hypothetical protein